jgi:hypothetical protein
MCEFLSFGITKSKKIVSGASLTSHDGICSFNKLKEGEVFEAEWTAESATALTVRVPDSEENDEKYIKEILSKYPKRINLINYCIEKINKTGGWLDLRGLTSAEGLTLPQSIGGGLDLSGLTSAEGLTLPQSIGGELDLRGLTSAEGLTLPQSIGGELDLSGKHFKIKNGKIQEDLIK